MRDAPAPGALVALRGVPPRILTGLVAARPAAVAVAAVAAAAQDDLDAAARAQVQAGGLVHAHPGTTEVLDGLVQSAPHCCGTAFIGIARPVIKAHGGSNAEAIENAVGQAIQVAQSGITEAIAEHIDKMQLPTA